MKKFTPLRSFGRIALALAVGGAALVAVGIASERAPEPQPNILIVSIDTLRADRLSSFGYERPTSPNIDRLLASGVRFTNARTVEPLTNPALSSMITSLYPHQHGGSRNGLRLRAGLASLPKALQAHGYRTSAFVGNWTLRDKLSGLAEHFDRYEEVLTRRRWFGLVRKESTAEDITASALDWLGEHNLARPGQPFMIWAHYVEPHAPYRMQSEYAEALGLADKQNITDSDRYDTEIAYVDHWIGRLVSGLEALDLDNETIIVLTSDHGESLGEHGYWGHGRHLYEPTLRIPMGVVWPGTITPQTVDAPALIVDLGPTVLGLLGHGSPADFVGFDWTDVLAGAEPPLRRVTRYQAHRGAVISKHDSDLARQSGLLEVGVIRADHKEIFRVEKGRRLQFNLTADPEELSNGADPKTDPSEGILDWMRVVYDGLASLDQTPIEPLDDESAEQLRSLGYVD